MTRCPPSLVQSHLAPSRHPLGCCVEVFALAVDKGTLDAIICTNDPEHWVKTYMKELFRVLRPDGSFVLITGYEPHDLMKYFSKHPWSVEHSEVEGRDGATAHLYVASKVAEVSIHTDYDMDEDNLYSESTGLVTGVHKRTVRHDPDRAPGDVAMRKLSTRGI
jgi:SAM-dependent methyltransferase